MKVVKQKITNASRSHAQYKPDGLFKASCSGKAISTGLVRMVRGRTRFKSSWVLGEKTAIVSPLRATSSVSRIPGLLE
jgi:hypothetical protein